MGVHSQTQLNIANFFYDEVFDSWMREVDFNDMELRVEFE